MIYEELLDKSKMFLESWFKDISNSCPFKSRISVRILFLDEGLDLNANYDAIAKQDGFMTYDFENQEFIPSDEPWKYNIPDDKSIIVINPDKDIIIWLHEWQYGPLFGRGYVYTFRLIDDSKCQMLTEFLWIS